MAEAEKLLSTPKPIKALKLSLLSFLLLTCSFGHSQNTIDFIWKAANNQDHHFEHAAILIPVHLEDDTITHYLQFDTGASFSSLYSRRLKGNDFKEKEVKTSLGTINFRNEKSIAPSKENLAPIGTLGADFLAGKIVLIDFLNQQISFLESYQKEGFSLRGMSLPDGRPTIEIKIRQKYQKLLYDTGSSLFGIWTSKRNWKRIRNKAESFESFPISSWGKINEGIYCSVDPSLDLFPEISPNPDPIQVWHVDNRKFKRFFRKNGLYGILGNQAFQESRILLDFKNLKFGVFKEKSSSISKLNSAVTN